MLAAMLSKCLIEFVIEAYEHLAATPVPVYFNILSSNNRDHIHRSSSYLQSATYCGL